MPGGRQGRSRRGGKKAWSGNSRQNRQTKNEKEKRREQNKAVSAVEFESDSSKIGSSYVLTNLFWSCQNPLPDLREGATFLLLA